MFKQKTLKTILSIMILVLFSACRDNPERHLQLGSWYVQKGLHDEAVLEFKEVTRFFAVNKQSLTREENQILSKAHYNLALVYTKKGWWEYALAEAETCFDLQPTKDHYDLVELIKSRAELESVRTNS